MKHPAFYDQVETIVVRDPLANFLGAFEGGIIEYSYLDVARLAPSLSGVDRIGAVVARAPGGGQRQPGGDAFRQPGDVHRREIARPVLLWRARSVECLGYNRLGSLV